MMKSRYPAFAVAGVIFLTLAACGGYGSGAGYGSGSSSSYSSGQSMTAYTSSALAVDQVTPGVNADANLINPWGLAFMPQGFVWVIDNGTNAATLYDGNGIAQAPVVFITPGIGGAARPTGIVFNDATARFQLTTGGVTGYAPMIFAGEAGTISAWSAAIIPNQAVTVVDNGSSHAVYKGLAILTGTVNRLYAADFHNNRIDVFDSGFNPITVAGGFTDAGVPAGYAPFNIQAINGQLYVAYAKTTAGSNVETTGAGLGYVSVFDSDGVLVKHLVASGALNAPWGMAMAPANFGSFSNDLLVGNLGDGKINVYSPATGAQVGTISKADGSAIVIPGLWGLSFGDGVATRPANALFYTAGPGNGAHGVFGRIDVY